MNIKDIYIRDPYILLHEGVYYMYGKTREDALEFVVYKSRDLEEWSEPKTVFRPGADFWATRDFWAPEVHIWRGAYYMLASFKSDTACRGTQILKADAPDAEFKPISEGAVTPADWESLDGTLYVDKKGRPHIVFCHEWMQIADGTICETLLSDDLTSALSEPRVLWSASDFKAAVNAFDDGRKSLVTDGPFMVRSQNGELYCTWSTFSKDGYTVCIAKSSNGDIDGNWRVFQTPLYANNSGHGMTFEDLEGQRCFVMHEPNVCGHERAVIYPIKEQSDGFKLEMKKHPCGVIDNKY